MEGDIAQLQRLPVRMRLRPGKVGPVRGEGELTQLVKRHLGAEQRGQRADGGEQRRAQKQQRQGIGRRHGGIGPAEAVGHPEHQPDGAKHHNIRPVNRAEMEGIGANDMVPILPGVREVELIKHILRAFAIEGQLFAPLQHRLVVVIQLIFRFAQAGHMFVHPRHQHKTAPDGERHPQRRHQHHFA